MKDRHVTFVMKEQTRQPIGAPVAQPLYTTAVLDKSVWCALLHSIQIRSVLPSYDALQAYYIPTRNSSGLPLETRRRMGWLTISKWKLSSRVYHTNMQRTWQSCSKLKVCINANLGDNLGVFTNLVAGFNEFISERERAKQKSKDPRIILFDEIVLSKRNRGRSTFFSGRMTTDFLSDTSNHLWRSASASSFSPTTRKEIPTSLDWKSVVTRG